MSSSPPGNLDRGGGGNNLDLLSAADEKLFPENNIKRELRMEATSSRGRGGEGAVTDKMEETFLSQPSKECVWDREGGIMKLIRQYPSEDKCRQTTDKLVFDFLAVNKWNPVFLLRVILFVTTNMPDTLSH